MVKQCHWLCFYLSHAQSLCRNLQAAMNDCALCRPAAPRRLGPQPCRVYRGETDTVNSGREQHKRFSSDVVALGNSDKSPEKSPEIQLRVRFACNAA
jgi:hypothetical protein